MGSFPFVIDAVIDSGICYRPKFPLLAWRPRSFPSDLTSRSARISSEDIGKLSLSCCCRKHPRCLVNCLNGTGTGSGEAESGGESGVSLQASIEKSKKVLALQNDLLNQIAERKKLISAIKSSIADTAPTDGGDRDEVHRTDISSASTPAVNYVEENPRTSFSNVSIEDVKEPGKKGGNYPRQFKNSTKERSQYKKEEVSKVQDLPVS